MPCLVSLMALSVQLLRAVFPQPPPDIPQSFADLSKGAGRVQQSAAPLEPLTWWHSGPVLHATKATLQLRHVRQRLI